MEHGRPGVVSAILTRRSIRRGFTDRPVDDPTLTTILDCGCAAPSSKDAQPWVIHAVRDRAVLASIAEAMLADVRVDAYVPLDPATGRPRRDLASSVRESAAVLAAVPLGLFLEDDGSFSTGRRNLSPATDGSAEPLVGYAFELFGVAAALQNMWLAAHALGLAGVFLGDAVIAEDAVREVLGLQGDLVGVLALGHSAASPHAPRRLLPGRAVVHPGRSSTPGGPLAAVARRSDPGKVGPP